MKLFWCGWEIPEGSAPHETIAADTPPCMQKWLTRYFCDTYMFVGAVYADDADHAWEIILDTFGQYRDGVYRSWKPMEKPDDWDPGMRFSDFDLPLRWAESQRLVAAS